MPVPPLTFAFLVNGEAVELKTAPADLMRFQRHFKIDFGQWAQGLADDPGSVDLEQILHLGWLTATRKGLTTEEFEKWVDHVEFDEQAVTVGSPLAPGKPGSSGSPRSSASTRTSSRRSTSASSSSTSAKR